MLYVFTSTHQKNPPEVDAFYLFFKPPKHFASAFGPWAMKKTEDPVQKYLSISLIPPEPLTEV